MIWSVDSSTRRISWESSRWTLLGIASRERSGELGSLRRVNLASREASRLIRSPGSLRRKPRAAHGASPYRGRVVDAPAPRLARIPARSGPWNAKRPANTGRNVYRYPDSNRAQTSSCSSSFQVQPSGTSGIAAPQREQLSTGGLQWGAIRHYLRSWLPAGAE